MIAANTKHGRYSAEMIGLRRGLAGLKRAARQAIGKA
jgi:hypothetical protein